MIAPTGHALSVISSTAAMPTAYGLRPFRFIIISFTQALPGQLFHCIDCRRHDIIVYGYRLPLSFTAIALRLTALIADVLLLLLYWLLAPLRFTAYVLPLPLFTRMLPVIAYRAIALPPRSTGYRFIKPRLPRRHVYQLHLSHRLPLTASIMTPTATLFTATLHYALLPSLTPAPTTL
jgi:hypothetical protein